MRGITIIFGPAVVISVLLAGYAYATTEYISGPAATIDGDTLQIGEDHIRIEGIDAFEMRQTCLKGGKHWACGEAAARRMAELVSGWKVYCRSHDTDRYGRKIATCKAGGVDVGGELVLEGLALAYTRYSDRYVPEEAEARKAHRGAWAGKFTAPWDWRHRGG